jgi:hypothetical protein
MGTALGQTSVRLGDGSGNSSLTVLSILGTRFELATVRLVAAPEGACWQMSNEA